MRLLLIILCVSLTFAANLAIGNAEDSLLADALARQIKSWDAEVSSGRGSRKCNDAFYNAAGASAKEDSIVATWKKLESISHLCNVEQDALGAGLLWTDAYVKISSFERNQISYRPYLLGALNEALMLLTLDNLDPILKASLIALETEIAVDSQQYSQVDALARDAETRFAELRIKNSLSLAIALSNDGDAKSIAGDLEGALRELERSEQMVLQLDKTDVNQLATNYRRMAAVYDLMEQPQPRQAVEYLDKAKELFDKTGQQIYSANMSFNKGITLLDVGLYDQAIDAFTDAKKSYLTLGKEKRVGNALYNLGKAWYGKGMGDTALESYEEAEHILETNHAYNELAGVYISIGILYENRMTGESYLEAQGYYEKAEEIFQKHASGVPSDLRALAVNKGKLYERWGKYEEANKEYLKAEHLLSGARPNERLVIYNNLAYIASLRKEYDRALIYAKKALKDFEETLELGFYFGGARNLRFIDDHLSSYAFAVEALIKKGELEKAYKLREEGRNRIFQMMVRLKATGKKDEGVAALWQEKMALERQISELDQQGVQEHSDTDQTLLVAQRKELEKKLVMLERGFFQSPDLYQRIFRPEPLDLRKVRRSLKKDEALIDYQVSKEPIPGDIRLRMKAFIIRKDRIKVIDLFEGSNAYETIRLVTEYIDQQKPPQTLEYSEEGDLAQTIRKGAIDLYQGLFKKLEAELKGIKKIHIIPDVPLNLLPFETLCDGQGKLLVEKYAISYLNSVRDVYQHSVNTNKGFLIFGDIDYGRSRKDLRQWPRIEDSAEILADINKSMQGQMPLTYVHGAEATENQFKSISPGHKIVLIWTHGEFNDYSKMPPMLKEMSDTSGGLSIKTTEELKAWDEYQYRQQFNDPLSTAFIIFAGVNQGGDGLNNNGYLTARKAMGLNLEGTELTILAACETGLGKSSPSEGILGLKRAFSIAGSRQLLISLWQVDAKRTGELIKSMLRTYDKLGGARALQRAKKALIKKLLDEGREPLPFYWAGFILVGKGN